MYRLVASLFQPLTFGFLCAILATLLLWRKRRGRRRRLIVATAVILLFAFACTDLVSNCALRSLESSYVQLEEIPDDVSIIVVLGGGLCIHRDSHPKGVELTQSSIARCINAAELYHSRKNDDRISAKKCTILISGRHADPEYSGKPEAELMQDLLLRLGVAQSDMILEDRSLSTYQNAALSAEILRERGVERIALVTDATHMYRASRCFQRQGLEVVPAACHFRASKLLWSPFLLIPNSGGARNLRTAMHEWQGIVWYKLHGRI